MGQGPKGIVRLSANGGKPETIVTVKEVETAHGPQLLPGAEAILFTVTKGFGEDRWDKAQIVVQSLRTGERKVLIDGGSDDRYVPTGHIVYALGSTMYGIPFDPKKTQVMGGPVPLIEGVLRAAAVNTAAAFCSFSNKGSPPDRVGVFHGFSPLFSGAMRSTLTGLTAQVVISSFSSLPRKYVRHSPGQNRSIGPSDVGSEVTHQGAFASEPRSSGRVGTGR